MLLFLQIKAGEYEKLEAHEASIQASPALQTPRKMNGLIGTREILYVLLSDSLTSLCLLSAFARFARRVRLHGRQWRLAAEFYSRFVSTAVAVPLANPAGAVSTAVSWCVSPPTFRLDL